MLGLFGLGSWLPLSSLLDEQNAVSAVFVVYSNENRSAFAPDEYICYFVYGDSGFGEDRDGAVIRSFSYAQWGSW